MRIDANKVQANDIRIGWSAPLDEGGDKVTGYRLYLNYALWFDASD